MAETQEKWCPTCSTRHDAGPICPGEMLATGPERYGWRVCVTNGAGRSEEFTVLVAPSRDLWRARILTKPKMLWCVPGARTTMKFVGRSAQDVEKIARRYIETFCTRRGLKCSVPHDVAEAGGFEKEASEYVGGSGATDERMLHSIDVKFGLQRPERAGTTGNLSKGGLFIMTKQPIPKGNKICLTLQMREASLPLRGVVVWSRNKAASGREPGMGVQLVAPPALYQHYVARLADAQAKRDEAAKIGAKPPAVPA